MITLSIFLSFCSVWCLYSVSERVEFAKSNRVILWLLRKNTKVAKVAALAFFVAATIVLCSLLNSAIGMISSLLIWMTLSSGIILFAPFPKFKAKQLALLFLLLLAVELCFLIFFK